MTEIQTLVLIGFITAGICLWLHNNYGWEVDQRMKTITKKHKRKFHIKP